MAELIVEKIDKQKKKKGSTFRASNGLSKLTKTLCIFRSVVCFCYKCVRRS